MASNVTIAKATQADAVELAAKMRPADADEVRAMSGADPLRAVTESMGVSHWAFAVRFDGELACIWGVAPLHDNTEAGRVGIVWMLTTAVVERQAKTFWRVSQKLVPSLFTHWDELINAIDTRHVRALRWAKRLGFELSAPEALGVEGRSFQRFRVTREILHV